MSIVIKSSTVNYGPGVTTDGLLLYWDAANNESYPDSGLVWYDIIGFHDGTMDGAGITYNNGIFDLVDGGVTASSFDTNSTTCTVLYWMKTVDVQALFLSGSGYFLGAFRVDNKEYYSGSGTPVFYMDTVDTPNIYDYVRDGDWHMLEFKSVNASAWTDVLFNQYASYTFGDGSIGMLMIYDKNLSSAESLNIYNSTKTRFGL